MNRVIEMIDRTQKFAAMLAIPGHISSFMNPQCPEVMTLV